MRFRRRSLASHAWRVSAACGLGVSMQLPAALAQEAGLEEIVVTAQKREERLQDVPISVTAFNEQALENLVADSIGDIDRFVPNLSVGDDQVTQPGYAIRGIGTSDFGVGLEPAVGVYVDGVYVGRSGASRVAFNDVARVEVLNGPQGTLFGRNAAAGAIQIVTNKPVGEEQGWAKLTLGNYDKVQVEGVYNVPLSDALMLRAGVLYNDREGYIDDDATGDDRGDEHNWSVNAALRWLPREDLDVILRLDYDDIDQGSQAQSSATLGPRHKGPNFRRVENDGVTDETRELWGGSAHVVWDLGGAELTSITAYRGYSSYNRRDMDGSAVTRYYFDDLNDEDNEQFSQELRFASTGDSAWHWTAGANYFWESAKQVGGVFIGPQLADMMIWDLEIAPLTGLSYDADVLAGTQVPQALADLGGLDSTTLYPGAGLDFLMNSSLSPYSYIDNPLTGRELIAGVDNWLDSFKVRGEYQSYAVFGDLGYDFNRYFTLTGGLRWTRDEKNFGRFIAFNEYGIPLGFPQETLVDDEGDYDPDNGTLGWYRQDRAWDELTGRVVLDYHVTEDVLLYASWATGYKSGGFNSAGAVIDEGPLDNETVENAEIGIKSTFFDNRVRVNGAYFDYTYENLQRQVFVDALCRPAGSTVGAYEFVTDDVEGDGYELSVAWQVTERLTVGANTGEVNAEYTKSITREVVDGKCVVRDRSGEDFAASPSNYSLFADLDLPLDSGALLNFSVNYSFVEGGSRSSCKYVSPEGYIYDLSKDPDTGVLEVTRQSASGPALAEAPFGSCPSAPDDEYATARASYLAASGRWEFALYARNLMREDNTGDPGGLGGSLRTAYWDGSPTYSSPREPEFYGAEFRYNFR